MLKITRLIFSFLLLITTSIAYSGNPSVSSDKAIQLVDLLSKQLIDHLECIEGTREKNEFYSLYRKFFTEELARLISWEKMCPDYKHRQDEIPATSTSLLGQDFIFGEFTIPKNGNTTFVMRRPIALSATTEKDTVIVTAKYTLTEVPSWTKFTIVSTPQGPRIDDIQMKGAGNEYEVYGMKVKSLKARLKKEYECTQKKLKKDCNFIGDERPRSQ